MKTAWKPMVFVCMDTGSKCWFSRKASRIHRLTRLRSTARRNNFLGAINPNMQLSCGFSYTRYRHSRGGFLRTVERVNSRWKLRWPRKILERGNDWSGSDPITDLFCSFVRVTYSKLVTPFGTSSFKHVAPVFGFHAFTESVLVWSLSFTWLVRTFHNLNL